jgi:NAD(P)-dependent dehydrogenase (short-subunit alcohol dehydrogenase family)
MDAKGAIALVTGGASGLGNATVSALVAAGSRVVVFDLESQRAVFRSNDRSGSSADGNAVFCAGDVTSESDVAAAIRTATEWGELRILVNCAGIAPAGRVIGRSGPLPLSEFERAISINLMGTFNALRLSAAAMQSNEPIDGERGVIVNTASIAAFDGQVGQAAYSASKGAIVAMTLPLARELAVHQIRVNAIAPGIFETPLMAGFSDEVKRSLGEQVPHPARLGRPSEFAALVLQVVANGYLNGETIRLDGSIRMAPRV